MSLPTLLSENFENRKKKLFLIPTHSSQNFTFFDKLDMGIIQINNGALIQIKVVFKVTNYIIAGRIWPMIHTWYHRWTPTSLSL